MFIKLGSVLGCYYFAHEGMRRGRVYTVQKSVFIASLAVLVFSFVPSVHLTAVFLFVASFAASGFSIMSLVYILEISSQKF